MWVEYESKSNHIQPMHKAAQKENYPFSISAGVEYPRILVPLHPKAVRLIFWFSGDACIFAVMQGAVLPHFYYILWQPVG